MMIIHAAVLVFIVGFVASTNAQAQDRMLPIPPEKMTDAQRNAAEEFKTARGTEVSGPFVPLLRSPEVMNRARAMGDYLRFKSSLTPALSEFVILMAARRWTQHYEWSVHQPIALKAGLDPEIVRAIADGRRPARMTDDHAILYDLCDELHRIQSVSDATYARAVARFGEHGVIDTVSITGYYTFLAMVLNTARTPPAPGTPVLQPLPR